MRLLAGWPAKRLTTQESAPISLRVSMEVYLHRVLFLRQRGLVTLQRGGHDRLLAADRGGGEGRVLQVQGVLLGPHV